MDWVVKEMQGVELGDERLNKRVIKLLDGFSKDPQSSIPQACQDWSATKAAYRFFDNQKVTLDKILQPHKTRSIERIKQEKRILLIQDTTEINYTNQKEKQDVGPSHYGHEGIIFLHPSLAVTPDKKCLGITNLYSWHREQLQRKSFPSKSLQSSHLHHTHISEKESYRWLLGYRHATQIAKECLDTHVIMVADRESDISDIYDEAEQSEGIKADWLVRARNPNRVLLDSNGKRDEILLRDRLLLQKPAAFIEFELPRRDKRPSRKVIQEVKILRVQMHQPTGRRGQFRLRPFWVTAVLAIEIKPPENEEAIEWLLLTSIELNDETQAQDIVQWYLCRWQIEVFFYILKSGCKVEQIQLNIGRRFMPCIGLYCIIAWRILFLTQIARVSPDENCECLFERIEWQLAYIHIHKKPPPDKTISLSDMMKLIARLGGFLARKNDKEPGPKTIWRGLKKLDNFVANATISSKLLHDTYG